MATSETRTFDPQFNELLTEAFERIQIQPRDVVQDHIEAALRSANLMLIDFANRGVLAYQLVQATINLEAGEPTYDLPAGTIDAWSVILRRDNQDVPVWPMGRSTYHQLPDKTNTGRPFNYFTDRAKTGLNTRTITLWPVPDRDSDTLELWVWKFAEDAGTMSNTTGIAKEWFDAYAAGLAARLARKYPPKVGTVAELKAEADVAFYIAKGTDRERAPLRIRVRGYCGRGRR